MSLSCREFQVFVKPVGARCNLACDYCYYLPKQSLYPEKTPLRLSDELLETYIVQHLEACTDSVVRFSWHGGEPTLWGLPAFRKLVALQHKHRPVHQEIVNGIQTNGTLIDDEWCRFFAQAGFSVGLSMDGPETLQDRHRVTRAGQPTHARVLQTYHQLLRLVVGGYVREGKRYMTVAIGCTGGKHRSVAIAEALAGLLAENPDLSVRALHRDLGRE